MALSGVRSSWLITARNSLLARFAASAASRAARSAVTSVFVPNQRTTRPSPSRSGNTRVRNGRNPPSAPRSGNVISKDSPVATDACQRSSTAGSTAGSCTDCQPQPSICSGVVPVYSYQRALYQSM